VAVAIRLQFIHFEHGKELVFTELEERIAFSTFQLLQVEDVFIESDRLFDVVDFDNDMVTAI